MASSFVSTSLATPTQPFEEAFAEPRHFGSKALIAGSNSIIGCAAYHMRSKCASNFAAAIGLGCSGGGSSPRDTFILDPSNESVRCVVSHPGRLISIDVGGELE